MKGHITGKGRTNSVWQNIQEHWMNAEKHMD